jgi:MoaA/NifB/PqqE/SkfB family radical SAM enzyme
MFKNNNSVLRISLDSVDSDINQLTRGGDAVKILNVIQSCISTGLKTSVRSVITQYNLLHLPKMALTLSDIGVKQWVLRRVVESNANNRLSVPMEEEIRMVRDIFELLSKKGSHLQLKYRSQTVRGTNIIIQNPLIEQVKLGLECNSRKVIWDTLIPHNFSLTNHMNKYLRSFTKGYSEEALISENT